MLLWRRFNSLWLGVSFHINLFVMGSSGTSNLDLWVWNCMWTLLYTCTYIIHTHITYLFNLCLIIDHCGHVTAVLLSKTMPIDTFCLESECSLFYMCSLDIYYRSTHTGIWALKLFEYTCYFNPLRVRFSLSLLRNVVGKSS